MTVNSIMRIIISSNVNHEHVDAYSHQRVGIARCGRLERHIKEARTLLLSLNIWQGSIHKDAHIVATREYLMSTAGWYIRQAVLITVFLRSGEMRKNNRSRYTYILYLDRAFVMD